MYGQPEGRGSRRGAGLLHWTVLPLGPLEELGCDPGAILRALADVYAEPFTLVFDKIVCREGGSAALALDRQPPGVRKLRQALTEALWKVGVDPAAKASRPHVTLDYAWHKPSVSRKIAPIAWDIDHVLLVESVIGKERHNHLGRRQLVPRQGTLFPLRQCDDRDRGTLCAAA